MNEVQLLEFVCDKITKLTALSVKNGAASEKELANMDHTNKAVLAGMLNQGVCGKRVSYCGNWSQSFEGQKMSGNAIVTDMPVSREVIESWNLHVLELNDDGLRNLVLWIFFDSHIGRATTRCFTTQDISWPSTLRSKRTTLSATGTTTMHTHVTCCTLFFGFFP